ncbi:MAG TPA: IclR family transcriptional regulator [Candidatus Tectomicrobia bacterium]|nr:IclR family transcriptional regulator [Candidatus Tectomicrobia bacterium]
MLDVLEFLAETRDGFTLATLSRRLRVPKSSLLALLRTFVDRRYLEQPEPGGAYRLGPRAAQLGLRPAAERELPEAAAPVLRDLAERTGESVFLGVLAPDSREVVYIARVESRHRLRYTADLGERRPLHCSAPGLAILALLPEAERARLAATLPLRPYTRATVTDRDRLRARLDDIRRAGVAVTVDEFIVGATGVAAPVLDRDGAVRAACTVIGPTSRVQPQREAIVRAVKAAADRISRALGAG